jgi:WD40 repeat protein
MRHALLTLAAVLLSNLPAQAVPTPIAVAAPARKEPVSYAKDVADILDAKCVGCHSGALAENKLNIEEVAGMLKGGKHGPSIVPGKADDSLLFKMAAHRVEPVMPPKDKKDQKPLTPEELGILKLWIDSGAKDDSEENKAPAKPIELGTLPPGVQPIVAVDMTADGTRVAAGRANVVQVYDADSGLEIVSLGGHKDIIQSIRFTPDGKRLAAGSYQIVTLWNVPTGGVAKTFAGHGDQVKALAVSADGKTAFSGSLDRTVRVWDVAAGTQLRQLSIPDQVFALAVSPDGLWVAAGGPTNVINVVSAADGKLRAALKGHTGPINDLAFLPDGKHVVSVSGDGTGRIWTVPAKPEDKPGEPIVMNGHKGPVRSVAVSPNGQTIATGGEDGTIQLWHATDGKSERTFGGHTGPVLALAISPQGDALLAGSADKTATLHDLATGTIRKTLAGLNAAVTSVAFDPKGTRLVTATAEGGMKVWDAANGQGVIAFGHTAPNNQPMQPLQKVAFTAEGALISASADRTLKSWTFEGAWSEFRTLGPHVFRVLCLDFNPDGTLLAAGGGDPSRSGEIKIWEVGKGMLVRSMEAIHSDTVFGVRFSPDGSKLASAAADKFLKITNVADGKELKSFEGHTHHVLCVDWKSDGKQLVTGGADNVLKIWEYDTGEQLRTTGPVGKQITAVRWIAGKPEVLGAAGDKVVRKWNPDNGGVAQTYSGPSDYVFGLGASKDGLRVAAGGADSVLFIWNGQNTQVIRKIEPLKPATPAQTAMTKP